MKITPFIKSAEKPIKSEGKLQDSKGYERIKKVSKCFFAILSCLALGVLGYNYFFSGKNVEKIDENHPLFKVVQEYQKKDQCPSIDEFVSAVIGEGNLNFPDEDVFRELFGTNRDLSNKEVRAFYHSLIEMTPTIIDSTKNENCLDDAKLASDIRHVARVYTRERGSFFSHKFVEVRDFFKYGHFSGPTFDEIVQKQKSKGFKDQELCDSITSSSQRTSRFYG